jgi:SAM-dependent methyltransferase
MRDWMFDHRYVPIYDIRNINTMVTKTATERGLMSTDELTDHVITHYASANLAGTFDHVLRSWGKGSGPLTPKDLEAVDQFHFGGSRATIELATLADIGPHTRVLDVGGGFGGPARTLAALCKSPVTVLDLTRAYLDVGATLTRRCGLQDLVSFQHGDGLAMPFADATFDRVWTQQSSMNIADKEQLYREIYRVLRNGGRLALYEVMAGTAGPLDFPVPWARDASISFLSPPETIHEMLTRLGFRTIAWEDLTDNIVASTTRSNPMPAEAPGLHLVLGDDFRERARNGIRNFAEHRASLIRAILERPRKTEV